MSSVQFSNTLHQLLTLQQQQSSNAYNVGYLQALVLTMFNALTKEEQAYYLQQVSDQLLKAQNATATQNA